jgi:archaellum biogenesis protein FlaJ (TadC family)
MLAGSFGGTGSADLTFLYQFTVTTIFIMVISNTFAMKVADGGAKHKIFFYGSIITAVSGLVMLVVPGLVSTMFAINV